MSLRENLPSAREWLGFAGWIVVVCALAYSAAKWRDHVTHSHKAAPGDHPAGLVALPVEPIRPPPVAIVSPTPVVPRVTEATYPFYTLELDATNGAENATYRRKGFNGVECISRFLQREIILSEDQHSYPAPQSGCGPTAILDWLIWYQNSGLVPRSTQHSDTETYKRITFDLIDRKIAELKGHSRTNREGANTAEIIVAFDDLVRELSHGKIRLHCEVKNAPLSQRDLLNQTRSYRAGILIVQLYDPSAPPPGGYHAVAVVRTDTTGRISIANWGKYEQGHLIQKPDGQWFATEDGSRPPMKVRSFLTFIPFRPTIAQ